MENKEKIIKTIEKITDIPADEITENSAVIDDLDLSSMEILAIISEIEHEFSIKISEPELLSIKYVSDLILLVNKKVG